MVTLALLLAFASNTGTLCAEAAQVSGADAVHTTSGSNTRRFGVWRNQFLKDGRPFQIISGSIHYHRYTASMLQHVP